MNVWLGFVHDGLGVGVGSTHNEAASQASTLSLEVDIFIAHLSSCIFVGGQLENRVLFHF